MNITCQAVLPLSARAEDLDRKAINDGVRNAREKMARQHANPRAEKFSAADFAPIKNPGGSRTGWVVRQKGLHWGAAIWYITDQQIKMSGSFLNMIINRKTNKVTIYSIKSNCYKRYGIAECGKQLGIYRAKKTYNFGPPSKGINTTYLGLPATMLIRTGKKADENQHKDVEFRDEIIITPEIKFSPEINRVFESVIYSIFEFGLPLKFVRYGYIKGRESRSTQAAVLSEVYFVKKRPIPDSEFFLPAGLRETQSEMDLMSGESDVSLDRIIRK